MNPQSLSFRRLTDLAAAPWHLLLEADPARDLVARYLAAGFCTLAYRQDDLVGEYVLTPLSADLTRWEIKNIAVVPAWRGKGLGQALLRQAFTEAAVQGATWLEIGTGNSSVLQLALYQKMGFGVKEVWPGFFTKQYATPIYENGMLCTDMIRLERRVGENMSSVS